MSSSRLFRATATLLSLASLAACASKKDDPAALIPTASMSWTVDGAAVTTTTLQSQKNGTTLSVAGTLNPTSAAPTSLMLEFPTATGTYVLGPNATGSFASYSPGTTGLPTVYYTGINPNSPGLVGTGTIVVTALTATSVTGTFTFTGITTSATASKAITNGAFTVGL